jgi:hypothetical protein
MEKNNTNSVSNLQQYLPEGRRNVEWKKPKSATVGGKKLVRVPKKE